MKLFDVEDSETNKVLLTVINEKENDDNFAEDCVRQD